MGIWIMCRKFCAVIIWEGIAMKIYTTVIENETPMGLKDCPVCADRYNILLNAVTGRNVMEIMFRNCSDKKVRSVYLETDCFNKADIKTGTIKDIAYMNVRAEAEQTFGEKQAVSTDFNDISRIDIRITQVTFADGTTWENKTGVCLKEMPGLSEKSAPKQEKPEEKSRKKRIRKKQPK
ncbi:MAG: hypothetical protein LUD77_03615 [Clostridiales bacterium]|nr:hypothetical protein [Clostridiales bacterium]